MACFRIAARGRKLNIHGDGQVKVYYFYILLLLTVSITQGHYFIAVIVLIDSRL